MRTIMHLNNQWFFKPSFNEADLSQLTLDDSFVPVRLPHTVVETPLNYFDETLYQIHSCYKMKLPSLDGVDLMNQEVVLKFEGVMTYSEIFVNGRLATTHKGGYTPFEVVLNPFLTDTPEQWIAVHVDSTEREDIPPFGFVVDFLTFGGIYREVQLEIRNKVHLMGLKVETPVSDIGLFGARVLIHLNAPVKQSYSIKAVLSENSNDESISTLKLTDLSTQSLDFSFSNLKNIKLWDCTNPNLYRIRVNLFDGDTLLDSLETRFGFRTVNFSENGFYLNGVPLKLMGLNRHQSYPYVGYAMPKSAQFNDAEILKYQLGVNIVRSSHYLPSRHFLDKCDEIGLMVFDEIPGWQHIGDKTWRRTMLENVADMIKRDWNHPSVVIWGVRINESADDDGLYSESNALARKLDTTRPTGGVRNFSGSHIYEDVYTYNDFSHRGGKHVLDSPIKIAKKKMPYLVTEHNGHMFPTKPFDSEAKRIEHALRHTRVLNHAFGTPEISGAIGWCMSDYNTHKDFGSGDKICYHGVMDIFRTPKYAASAYASQQNNHPYMNVASSMFVGDYDASELGKITIFTNCDFVKIYKNDVFVSSHEPDRIHFPNLPHPPIVINDLIGNQIKENERFSAKDADRIKKILLKFLETGSNLPLLYKLGMGYLFLKYKMDFADAASLYGKYIASWGEKSTVYRFEGYRENQCVCVQIKDVNSTPQLYLEADSHSLKESETYDVVRVVVRFADSNGQPLFYANPVAIVTCNGPLTVIGPSTFALIGGTRAFWLKTTGVSGTATLSVSLDNGLQKTLSFTIET